eukprot:TRINITY_DN2584_c0_g1_i1.p2 TRINITY_DN2584_c0_g1~~TRINITY_DN2584_c0_g1_i1.p2  ORF type:complete len:119 (+),score=62.11 TRINITY_DN2584_c0_g1_i1:65-421(+)
MGPKKPAAKPVKKKKEVEVRVRHILCKDEKKIRDLYQMFLENHINKGEDVPLSVFGDCARISDCPSGKKQGALGWFGKGKLEEVFERTAFSMRKGSISDVIQGSKGFHIIYLEDSREK